MLLAGENLRTDPPSRDIGSLNHRLQLTRQTCEDGSVFLCLKKTLSAIVFPKHRYVWPLDDLADLLA
jgi:hypothetical protein